MGHLDHSIRVLDRLQAEKHKSFLIAKARAFGSLIKGSTYINLNVEHQKPSEHIPYFMPIYDGVEKVLAKLNPGSSETQMKMSKEAIALLVMELKLAKQHLKAVHDESYIVEKSFFPAQRLIEAVALVESDKKINQLFDKIIRDAKITHREVYNYEVVNIISYTKHLTEKEAELKDLRSMYTPFGERLFSVENSPSNNSKSIRDLDELNANRIYGPTGYSLIRYLIQESQTALDTFENNIENMLVEMPSMNFDDIKGNEQKLEYCTNLNRLRKVYASSEFPVELGYDFAATNISLFHNLYEKNIILTDERKELRSQVYSALYAKALISKYFDDKDKQIDTIDDLVIAANSLEYPEKIRVCSRIHSSNHLEDSNKKFKCESGHKKALIDGNLGREMINVAIVRDKAVKIQQRYLKHCGFLRVAPEEDEESEKKLDS